jgi:AraC-like DNA-binding protein/mannose-6-phosphate isomerase-like protein (cupin superfamily)
MTSGSFRQIFTGPSECLIPELHHMGHVRYTSAKKGVFTWDSHAGIMEIFYFIRGRLFWKIEDEGEHLSGNHNLIIPPDTGHGIDRDTVQPSEYYFVQIKVAVYDAIETEKEDVNQNKNLINRLLVHARRSIPANPILASYFRGLFEEHEKRTSYSPKRARSWLNLIMTTVLEDAETHSPTGKVGALSSPIQKSVEWCQKNLATSSVEQMVLESKMKPALFRKTFLAEVGVYPSQFITNLRIDRAKHQLRQNGSSVAEISQALGFPSSQYFSTVFKKIEGVSPSEFQRTPPPL